MREMKDSGNMWIGATPETWKMIPLKYLASYNDEVLGENTDDEFEFDYIEIGSVQYGRGIIYTEHMKFKNAPSRARRIVRKDDIIVSTVRTYLKAVATIPACNNSLIASTGFIVIRPHKILPRFMNYALLSESFISLVESHSTGISYPAINSVDVVKFKIPVPCRSEQERIAAFLDAECAEIDAVLEKTRASIEEYKKLKQAVITQAVTKGIRGDRPMKDSGIEWIGEIPAEWDVVPFSKFARVSANLVNPSDYQDYLQVSPENIEKDSGKLLPCKTVSEVGVESWNHLFHKGQILYSKIRPKLNKVCIAPFDGLCSADMYPIDTDNVSKFVVYTVLSNDFYQQVAMITENRVKMPKINQKELSKLIVVLPVDRMEQQEIVDYLDDKCGRIDALIVKKQQYLTEIENYKKSLIYEYVTGKKEVV